MGTIHIERDTVQETLVIPLYGRRLCGELFPELYCDPYAAELCARLDYDFSALDRRARSAAYRFGALEAATRQLAVAHEVRDYLRERPRATVVNLGCGLDQTGRACDNGRASVLNVDLPDVIAARDELVGTAPRERSLACDLTDLTWLDEVDPEPGAVLVAAGVFHYLAREQVRAIVCAVGERLPGSRLVFDSVGRLLMRLMLGHTLRSMGIEGVNGPFYLTDPVRELSSWVPVARVSSRGYMLGYHDLRTPGVGPLFRGAARVLDGPCHMRVNRVDFPGSYSASSSAR